MYKYILWRRGLQSLCSSPLWECSKEYAERWGIERDIYTDREIHAYVCVYIKRLCCRSQAPVDEHCGSLQSHSPTTFGMPCRLGLLCKWSARSPTCAIAPNSWEGERARVPMQNTSDIHFRLSGMRPLPSDVVLCRRITVL